MKAKAKWFCSNIYAVPSDPRGSDDSYREFRMVRGRISGLSRRPGTWAIKKAGDVWRLFLVCPTRRCRALMMIEEPEVNRAGYPPGSGSDCDTCPKCYMHMWYSLKGFRAADYKKLWPYG